MKPTDHKSIPATMTIGLADFLWRGNSDCTAFIKLQGCFGDRPKPVWKEQVKQK